jgi:hypothetical protein
LPDGIFSNQKSQFGEILVGLAMEDVGIFYDLLVFFTAICSLVRAFGVCYGNLLYFSRFWYFVPRKIWQPCTTPARAEPKARLNLLSARI